MPELPTFLAIYRLHLINGRLDSINLRFDLMNDVEKKQGLNEDLILRGDGFVLLSLILFPTEVISQLALLKLSPADFADFRFYLLLRGQALLMPLSR